jgi:hypothetical protein
VSFGVVGGSMFFVTVVLAHFFHSTFLLLSEMSDGLWLLMGMRSLVLLVTMSFVNSMLLVGLVSLLMALMLAWVLLMLLLRKINSSNCGSIINEHSLSVRKVNKSIEFVGLS